ncbi:MAG: DUF1330 domain-containing protein [Pseudomonadota bacterium]
MACFSVLAVTPTTDKWIPGYLGPVGEIVAEHGGEYVARTTSHEQIEGAEAPAALRIIIKWPSMNAAKAFMADERYAPHLTARAKGSKSAHFLIEARDDLA